MPKVFLSGYAKLPDNTTAQKLLTGYDLHRGPEPLVELLNQTYHGHLRKALQTCIKGICLQFGELNRAAAKQSG